MIDFQHTLSYTSKSGAVEKIEFIIRGDSTIDEMLEAYANYLKAVGFYVDPRTNLEFVEED